MNRRVVTLVGGALLAVATLGALLPACGGSAPATAVPTATATPQRSTPMATPAPTANVPLSASPSPVSDLLAQGKLVFEETAGGVGCAFCHGMDGKGNGPSGLGAPANRGASEQVVRSALNGGVEAMSTIKLTDAEITAVVAYLKYLGEQP